jgi:hypothetical protein
MDQLIRQLKSWQSRERLFRFVWALARFVAVVLVGLAVCCLIDWTFDRYRDTPFALRVALTGGQILVAVAAIVYLFRLGTPSLDVLAGKAEEAYPEFDHRIVTALQLNRKTAKTDGMSKQLLADVTREAVDLSSKYHLPKLAETSFLKKAFWLLTPLALLSGLAFAWNSKLVTVLLQRQCLMGVDIPRSVALTNDTVELWPSGDPVRLSFNVAGKFTEQSVGTVIVMPEGQPSEQYELKFEKRIDDTSAKFVAEYPPSTVPFRFRARLHDGRTRADSRVRFEPRPSVKSLEAWLQLPLYVDPDGKRRYERLQPQGEVTALAGSGLRIEMAASKPLKTAKLVFLSRTPALIEEPLGEPVTMVLSQDRLSAEARSDIPAKAIAYRIQVQDDNGFDNLNPPRRGISTATDDPPRVNLLAEVLKDPKAAGPLDDYEVNGMPLVLGGQVQIGYSARSALGLSRAFVMYRVNDAENWTPLPLRLTVADLTKLGNFIPELGVFENSGEEGQVEFYPFPSANIEETPPGLEAGGRYNFQTAALKKMLNGKETKLEVGDRVEFHVAVYDRNPDPNRTPGRSESRIKAVVTQAFLSDWLAQRDQSRERLKQLEDRQRGVFGRGIGGAENPFKKN